MVKINHMIECEKGKHYVSVSRKILADSAGTSDRNEQMVIGKSSRKTSKTPAAHFN